MACADVDDPNTSGKSVGEECTAASECADGLICKDLQDENSNWYMACAETDDVPTGNFGEFCTTNEDCNGIYMLCIDVMTEDGMTTEMRCGYAEE